jgi:large subunit ribosomal protein L4
MTLDVVNKDNQKVGSVDVADAVFSGPIKTDLIWESVVRQNASERRGTHKAKNRALVSGGGKKPYKQKGTAARRLVRRARHSGAMAAPCFRRSRGATRTTCRRRSSAAR